MADDLAFEGINAGIAVIAAPSTIKAGYARTRQNLLSDLISDAAGDRVRVEIRIAAGTRPASETPVVPTSVAHSEALKDPLVRRAMELFDARVVDVRDDDKIDPSGPLDPARAPETDDT